ncbi:MAG: DUF2029 domain-containing protein [Candidatus Obscuribacterales bacterium]|nr:DUF2029 domain-containing protein [Candidatus Obscuribacterales bacterium]
MIEKEQKDKEKNAHPLLSVAPYLIAVISPIVPLLMLARSFSDFRSKVSDLPEYYTAAWLFLSGRASEIYSLRFGLVEKQLFPDLTERVVPFLLAPPAVVLVVPLAFFSPQQASLFWTIFLGACLLSSVVLLARLNCLSRKGFLYFFALVSIFGAAFESLKLGQIAPFLLLSYSLGLYLKKTKRPILAALAFSILAIKPQFFIALLFCLIGSRQYLISGLSISIALMVSLLVSLFIGIEGWQQYFDLMQWAFSHPGEIATNLNPTLKGQLLLLFGSSNRSIEIASLLVLLSAMAAIFLLARKKSSGTSQAAVLSCMPLAFLAAPYAQSYDLLLLLPSLVCFVANKLYLRISAWILMPLAILSSLFFLPFYSFVHYDYLLKGACLNPFFFLLLAYGAIIVVVVLKAIKRTFI